MSLKKKVTMLLAGLGFLSGTSAMASDVHQVPVTNEPITLTQGMNQQIAGKLLPGVNENNDNSMQLYHYSHSSHSSHYSHSSHTSHYSSYY